MDQVHSFSQVLVKYTMYSVAFKSILDTLDGYCTTNANNPTTNANQLTEQAEAASKISLLPLTSIYNIYTYTYTYTNTLTLTHLH